MKTCKLLVMLVGMCCLFLSVPSNAQVDSDSTQLVEIHTEDGNEYIGSIVAEDSLTIRLSTENLGEISIRKKDVTHRRVILSRDIVDGEVWPDNLQETRYFWAPSGYGLKSGEAYYQNVWILFNQFSYGFSDNFSVGVGTMPIGLLGAGVFPVWITPKVSVPIVKDKFNLGAGVLAATVLGEGESFGIAYGVGTFGSRDRNINLGVGYGYAGNDWANTPTITLSGLYRYGKRGYIVTENYLINGEFGVLSVGGRSVFSKIALDYGGIVPVEEGFGALIIIPWLGISVPLGKRPK